MLYEKNPSELNIDGLLHESIAVLRRQQEAPRFGNLATKVEGILSQTKVAPAPGVATLHAGVPLFFMEPDLEHLLREVEAGLLAVRGSESLTSKVRQARIRLMASRANLGTR